MLAHLAHHQPDVFARGQEENLVAVLDDGVALRLNALAGTIDGGDARIGTRDVLAQRAQRLTHQRTSLQRADTDQPHASIRKVEHLQRAGIADQTGDVLGDQLLGTDPHIDRDAVFAEQRLALGERGGAHARDFLRRPVQRPSDVAGQHVDLVAVGERDQDVGAGDAGGLENARTGRVAVDGANVEPILQIAQDVLVHVDDGDIVGLFP